MSCRLLGWLLAAAWLWSPSASAGVIPPCPHGIIYANATVSGGNGASWQTAFADLQQALNCAASGDQVWVAKGLYRPTASSDQTISFAMKNGVAIYGGFAGTETQLDQRNTALGFANPNVSILDGAIASGIFSYHVVTSPNTDATAVLDGFVIRKGVAPSSEINGGGALSNVGGSPTLRNLSLRQSSAKINGGCMSNINGSPTLRNAEIVGCDSPIGGGMYNDASTVTMDHVTFDSSLGSDQGGGAMLNFNSHVTCAHCTFNNNQSQTVVGGGGSGGAIHDFNGDDTLTDCLFTNNFAQSSAGAIYADQMTTVTIANCRFLNNAANISGGAIVASLFSTVTVMNSVFDKNSTDQGLGVAIDNSGGTTIINSTFTANLGNHSPTTIYSAGAGVTIENSIFWGNSTVSDVFTDTSMNPATSVIVNSNIPAGCPANATCTNLYSMDPLFVNALGTDGVVGTVDDDLHLQATSGLLDQGDASLLPVDALDIDGDGNTTERFPLDLDGKLRVYNSRVDLGPYEAAPADAIFQDGFGF